MKSFVSKACTVALAATLISGSALGQHVTVTDPTRLTQSGFLSEYLRLQKTAWAGGIECWRDPGLDTKKYDRLMISRIVLSLEPKEGEEVTIDPTDLKTLTDYFHDALLKALEPQMAIVNAVGGVKISEPAADLTVLAAIVSSLRSQPLPDKLVMFGEVGLAGEIRQVKRGLERLKEAAKLGFTQAIVPAANQPKQKIAGMEIHPVHRLDEAIGLFREG